MTKNNNTMIWPSFIKAGSGWDFRETVIVQDIGCVRLFVVFGAERTTKNPSVALLCLKSKRLNRRALTAGSRFFPV